MFKFTAATEGADRLHFQAALQEFADGSCAPAHLMSEDAADMVLVEFKLQVSAELEILTLEAELSTVNW